MELKDTVQMMASSDYKERFRGEYFQLKIRYEKLREMCNQWDMHKLDFKPACPRITYDHQLKAMDDYMEILRIRAAIENISLEF